MIWEMILEKICYTAEYYEKSGTKTRNEMEKSI